MSKVISLYLMPFLSLSVKFDYEKFIKSIIQELVAMSANHLSMRGINLAFAGFRALAHVDFDIKSGSVHALTGANGVGKSTLMAVLCGTHDRYQ